MRGSRTTLKFSEENGVQPDIVFISNTRRYLIHSYYVDGAPDVAIEILSPSTRKLDRGKKMALYAAHGVLELWQVDPELETTDFFRNDNGVWTSMPVNEDGIFHSKAISGFWLNVQWLFDEKTLNKNSLAMVPVILAGAEK